MNSSGVIRIKLLNETMIILLNTIDHVMKTMTSGICRIWLSSPRKNAGGSSVYLNDQ